MYINSLNREGGSYALLISNLLCARAQLFSVIAGKVVEVFGSTDSGDFKA